MINLRALVLALSITTIVCGSGGGERNLTPEGEERLEVCTTNYDGLNESTVAQLMNFLRTLDPVNALLSQFPGLNLAPPTQKPDITKK